MTVLQRMLTSLGLTSEAVQESAYQQGQLQRGKYLGLITLENKEVDSASGISSIFAHDRQNFTGVRIHIGGKLTSAELSALGAKQKQLYSQQFTIRTSGSSQQLPFTNAVTVLSDLPKQAQTFGMLSAQGSENKIPFGVSVGHNAFLPVLPENGLGVLQSAALIGHMFEKNTSSQPLLTITGINPYTDTQKLNRLTKMLHANGWPFALSVTSLATGTRSPEFYKYTKALRQAQRRGGIIFLRVPYLRQDDDNSRQLLSSTMQSTFAGLTQAGVYPVGMASPQFWQQIPYLQRHSTHASNTLLLLPDPSHEKLRAIVGKKQPATTSAVNPQTFLAVKLAQFKTASGLKRLSAPLPVAFTVSLPDSSQQVRHLEKELQLTGLKWYDPVQDQLSTRTEMGAIRVEYQSGHYRLNGRLVQIKEKLPVSLKAPKIGTQQSYIDKFFALGSTFLILIFVIIFLILAVLLVLGRKIYREMFLRK